MGERKRRRAPVDGKDACGKVVLPVPGKLPRRISLDPPTYFCNHMSIIHFDKFMGETINY